MSHQEDSSDSPLLTGSEVSASMLRVEYHPARSRIMATKDENDQLMKCVGHLKEHGANWSYKPFSKMSHDHWAQHLLDKHLAEKYPWSLDWFTPHSMRAGQVVSGIDEDEFKPPPLDFLISVASRVQELKRRPSTLMKSMARGVQELFVDQGEKEALAEDSDGLRLADTARYVLRFHDEVGAMDKKVDAKFNTRAERALRTILAGPGSDLGSELSTLDLGKASKSNIVSCLRKESLALDELISTVVQHVKAKRDRRPSTKDEESGRKLTLVGALRSVRSAFARGAYEGRESCAWCPSRLQELRQNDYRIIGDIHYLTEVSSDGTEEADSYSKESAESLPSNLKPDLGYDVGSQIKAYCSFAGTYSRGCLTKPEDIPRQGVELTDSMSNKEILSAVGANHKRMQSLVNTLDCFVGDDRGKHVEELESGIEMLSDESALEQLSTLLRYGRFTHLNEPKLG